jgi:hypothetical protein
MLIAALADPSTGAKLVGLNYFADTLLFGGTILSLARATEPERGRRDSDIHNLT